MVDAAELFGGRIDDEHAQVLKTPAPRPEPAPMPARPAPPTIKTSEPVSLDELATQLRDRLAYLDGEIERLDQLHEERNKVRRLLKAIGTED